MMLELTPRSLTHVFFRQRRKFLWTFFSVLALGLAYLFLATPYYESRASLLVKFGRDARPEITRGGSTEIAYNERREVIQSSMKILQSRDLIEALLEEADPATVYPRIAADPPAVGTVLDEAIRQFQSRFSVTTGAQSNVIDAAFQHADPEIAANLMRRLVELFESKYAEAYSQPQVGFLKEQVEAARVRIDTSQAELASFKRTGGISNLEAELGHAIRQRADIQAMLFERQAARAAADARRRSLSASLAQVPEDRQLPAELDRYKPHDEALARLTELRAREQDLLQTYTESSETVRVLRKNIAFAEREYQARKRELDSRSKVIPNPAHQAVQTDYLRASADSSSAAAPTRVLDAQLKLLDERIARYEEQKVQLANLARQVQLDEDNFRAIAQKLDEALIADGLNAGRISRISLIERPAVAAEPLRPRPRLVLTLATIAALALALAICLFFETFDERLSRAEQVERVLGVPTLAAFPLRAAVPGRRRRRALAVAHQLTDGGQSTEPARLLPVPLQDARDLLTTNEAVSLLRTIESSLPHVRSPIIQFATAHEGEGASTVSYAVADVAARMFGKRVLLINAGDRRQAQAPTFSLEEVAYGEVASAIDSTNAGPELSSINVASLGLSNGREQPPRLHDMIGLIFNRLRDRFDLVVVDAPPILDSYQTATLSTFTDGTVLVVEAERTRAPVAARARELVEMNGGRVLGVVLNKRRLHVPNWAYGRR